jgi:hypothetical protein
VEEVGHVFVVRGDLLALACDAIIVPTDRSGRVEPPWQAHLRGLDGIDVREGRLRIREEGPRQDLTVSGPFARSAAEPTSTGAPSTRQTWLVATGVLPTAGDVGPNDARWRAAIRALADVLGQFAQRFRSAQGELPVRGCPLVGVPLLGSAAGGFSGHFRPYASDLVRILRESARVGGFDVALVIHGKGERAAAKESLCRLERRKLDGLMPSGDHLAARWQLGHPAPKPGQPTDERDIRTSLDDLFGRARSGELIPFFGAGVSRSAGAVGWGELVSALEERAGLSDLVSGDLDLLARAQIVENSIGTDRLQEEISALLRESRVSLQHLLLASLGARDAITTNFDDAYERAVEDGGRGAVAVVPHPGSTSRLLKLHGSLPRTRQAASGRAGPGGGRTAEAPAEALRPILTRDQFIEHERHSGPLRGALQMMLLTGHVLFIGYSLSDPDLHAAIHEVRRIRELANIPSEEPLATALQVEPSHELSYLWAPTVAVLWPSSSEHGEPVGASTDMQPRELELLLDALADAANTAELPVLGFEPHELEEDERHLRETLTQLRDLFDGRELPPSIAALLHTYGAPTADGSVPNS